MVPFGFLECPEGGGALVVYAVDCDGATAVVMIKLAINLKVGSVFRRSDHEPLFTEGDLEKSLRHGVTVGSITPQDIGGLYLLIFWVKLLFRNAHIVVCILVLVDKSVGDLLRLVHPPLFLVPAVVHDDVYKN